ncbi:MAG: dephospho-CoA kinase [Flavobacteriales bacterium]|nr:dephospho-CoA kinase [Flavobacteriales bacterium]
MLVIGITGGIGSGKSTICKCFEVLGAPVFFADTVARNLYTESEELMRFVVSEIGEESYNNGKPDYTFIASKVFSNPDLIHRLERKIHPLVGERFEEWRSHLNSPYVLREAAILIESGSYNTCDEVVLVQAPMELRIQWIMKRNTSTQEEIDRRIRLQWTDEQKRPFAHHILNNDNMSLLMPSILKLDHRWKNGISAES